MKERELPPVGVTEQLTRSAQKLYPGVEGIIMDNGHNEELPLAANANEQRSSNVSDVPSSPLQPPIDFAAKLAEKGRKPIAGGAQDISTLDIGDAQVLQEINALNSLLRVADENDLKGLKDELQSAKSTIARLAGVSQTDKDSALKRIQERVKKVDEIISPLERTAHKRRSFELYLTPEAMQALDDNPIAWLDTQFSNLYRYAETGAELSSQFIQNLHQNFTPAARYIETYQKDKLEEFSRHFNIRFSLIEVRATMDSRAGIEQIQGVAKRLRAHGIFYGLSMEGGKVNQMFTRLQEFVDDERLKQPKQHVSNELMYRMQSDVIDEQFALARKGIGPFGKEEELLDPALTEEDFTNAELSDGVFNNRQKQELKAIQELPEAQKAQKAQKMAELDAINKRRVIILGVKSEIIRSVRTAYDTLVCSQRLGVIAARGSYLGGAAGYKTDSQGGWANVYNWEKFLARKFNILTAHDYEFIEQIGLDMANGFLEGKHIQMTHEEKLNLGRRLFRDLFQVSDYFTSGWRIDEIRKSITERFLARFGKDENGESGKNSDGQTANDFGLFFQLKQASAEPKKDEHGNIIKDRNGKPIIEREVVLRKIAKYRPEEVVKIFRETAWDDSRLLHLFRNDVFARNGIRTYDMYKNKFGALIRTLREQGFKDFRQLDIAENGFKDEEKATIRKWCKEKSPEEQEGMIRDLKEMFVAMSAFAKNAIPDLMHDPKFSDIYARTLIVDDAFLDELEKEEFEYTDERGGKHIAKFVPVSKKMSSEAGGDSLPRMWGDTNNAAKAIEAMMKMIKSEDMKERYGAAEQFAEFTSQYNGQEGGRAKVLRYTIGTDLKLRKLPFLADALGIKKMPFRLPHTAIEKIYGPTAEVQSREEILAHLDHEHSKLDAALSDYVDQPEEEDLKDRELFEKGDLSEFTLFKKTKERKEKRMKRAEDEKKIADKTYWILRKELGVMPVDDIKLKAFSLLLAAIFFGLAEGWRAVGVNEVVGKKAA